MRTDTTRAKLLASLSELEIENQSLYTRLSEAEAQLKESRLMRLCVHRFAHAMEERLKANDYKGGWNGC